METMRKLFMLLLVSAATVGLCSCVDDDDDDNTVAALTEAQKAAQVADMAGYYQGRIYFVNDSTQRNDSIPVSWQLTASDSLLTMRDFPAAVLAHGVGNARARQILLTAGEQTLTAIVHPYANSYNTQGYYTYWCIPMGNEVAFDTEYEGKAYHVAAQLMIQMTATYLNTVNYYAVGEYLDGRMLSYILVKSVTVDGSDYTVNRVCYFDGKK